MKRVRAFGVLCIVLFTLASFSAYAQVRYIKRGYGIFDAETTRAGTIITAYSGTKGQSRFRGKPTVVDDTFFIDGSVIDARIDLLIGDDTAIVEVNGERVHEFNAQCANTNGAFISDARAQKCPRGCPRVSRKGMPINITEYIHPGQNTLKLIGCKNAGTSVADAYIEYTITYDISGPECARAGGHLLAGECCGIGGTSDCGKQHPTLPNRVCLKTNRYIWADTADVGKIYKTTCPGMPQVLTSNTPTDPALTSCGGEFPAAQSAPDRAIAKATRQNQERGYLCSDGQWLECAGGNDPLSGIIGQVFTAGEAYDLSLGAGGSDIMFCASTGECQPSPACPPAPPPQDPPAYRALYRCVSSKRLPARFKDDRITVALSPAQALSVGDACPGHASYTVEKRLGFVPNETITGQTREVKTAIMHDRIGRTRFEDSVSSIDCPGESCTGVCRSMSCDAVMGQLFIDADKGSDFGATLPITRCVRNITKGTKTFKDNFDSDSPGCEGGEADSTLGYAWADPPAQFQPPPPDCDQPPTCIAGKWTTDLDNTDDQSCTRAGFVFTGRKCCSEPEDEDESYNDAREGRPPRSGDPAQGTLGDLSGIIKTAPETIGGAPEQATLPPPCPPGHTDAGVIVDKTFLLQPTYFPQRICIAGADAMLISHELIGAARPSPQDVEAQVPQCGPDQHSAGIFVDTSGMPDAQSFTGHRLCLSADAGIVLEGPENAEQSATAPRCPSGYSNVGIIKDRFAPGQARISRLCLSTGTPGLTPPAGTPLAGSIGGCLHKQFIGTGSLLEGNTLLNYMGKFWGCLVQDPAILALQDFHANSDLIEERGACQPAFEDAFGIDIHARCSARGVWVASRSLDTTHQKSVPFLIPQTTDPRNPDPKFGLSESDCCALDECWNGRDCQPHDSYHPIRESDSGYRCENGEWVDVPLKFSWDHRSSGFCRSEEQCLVNDGFNPDLDNNVSSFFTGVFNQDRPKCVADTQYIKDNYCDTGVWTTRTKLLGTHLLGFAEAASPGNYTLYCDDYPEVLNYFTYLTDFGLAENFLADECGIGIGMHACVNKMCALQLEGGTVIGASLNLPISSDRSFLKALNLSPSLCDAVSGDQFAACDATDDASVFYHPGLRLVIYQQPASIPGGSLDTPLPDPTDTPMAAMQEVAAAAAHADSPLTRNFGHFNRTSLFDHIYLARKGKKQIFAFLETDQAALNQSGIDYLGVKYANMTATPDLCEMMLEADDSAYCADVQPLDFIAVAKRVRGTPSSMVGFWKDLTAKLRPE